MRGFKLGPMVFVPELSVRDHDPWAHRKGEPRVIALLWAVYLLIAAAVGIFSVRSAGMSTSWQYHQGARTLLVLIVIGATVLWPMCRLSQAGFVGSLVRAVMTDLLVILAPMQAIVWPLPFITGWGWRFMGGVLIVIASWTLLALAIALPAVRIRRGHPEPSAGRRLFSMVLIIVCLAFGPLLTVAWNRMLPEPAPDWFGMLSPVTAVVSLTTPPSGHLPAMGPAAWRVVVGLLFVSGGLLLWASKARPNPIPAPGYT